MENKYLNCQNVIINIILAALGRGGALPETIRGHQGVSQSAAGTCPLCRVQTFKNTTIWRWNSRKGRIALLKRLAKKEQAPKPILSVVQKLNKAKKEHQEALKEQRTYSKKHMEIFRMDRKLRNIRWKKRMRMNHIEEQLAAFDPMALINLIN